MICPTGYSIIRHDRIAGRGGGVAMLYQSHLTISQYSSSVEKSLENVEDLEYISADLNCGPAKVRLPCFYIPPNQAAFSETIKLACKCIADCTATKCSYVFGDFNLPDIDWTIPYSYGGYCHDYFLEFCQDTLLIQHITDSTHSSGNTLDLLLCNTRSSELINTFCVSSPFSVSCDHFSLEMSMNFPIKKTEKKVSPRPNFKMADYGTICSYLHCVDWNNIIACHGCDIQFLYDCFLNIISDSIELLVPKFTKKQEGKSPHTSSDY